MRVKKNSAFKLKFFAFSFILFFAGCAAGRPSPEELIQKERLKMISRELGKEPPELSQDSELNEFVEFALLNNPEIQTAFYRWESAIHQILPARYLPDLRLLFEAEISDMADDMYMPGGMLSVPGFGKRFLRAERYSIKARQEEAALRQALLKISFRVKELAYRLWLIEERTGFLEESLEILSGIEEVSFEAVAADIASPLGVFNLGIEIDNLKNKIQDQKELKEVYVQKFAQTLGLDSEELNFFPKNVSFTQKAIDTEDIWPLALDNNPRLAEARAVVEESQTLVELAYREFWPDFAAGLMRSAFSTMVLKQPMLSVSVPWQGKVKEQIEASLSGQKGAESRYLSRELDLMVKLSEGLFRLSQAERERELYRGELIPKIESIFEMTLVRYQVGRASLGDVLEVFRQQLQYQYNYSSAKALREITLNELLFVIAGVMPDEFEYPGEEL